METPYDQLLPSERVGKPIEPGNIDLYRQPKVKNPDGSISTVDSIGVGIDDKEYLLPTVTPDGRHFTGTPQEKANQAVDEFRRTGKHLGVFRTQEDSNNYGKQLHEDYAAGLYDQVVTTDKSRLAADQAIVDRHLQNHPAQKEQGEPKVPQARDWLMTWYNSTDAAQMSKVDMEGINRAWVADRFYNQTPYTVGGNWPAFKAAVGQHYLGLPKSSEEIPETVFRDAITNRLKNETVVDDIKSYKDFGISQEWFKDLDPKMLPSMSREMSQFWQDANRPFVSMKTFGDMADAATMGMWSPSILGATARGLAPIIEGFETPLGIAGVGAVGKLASLGKTYPVARRAVAGISGLFTASMVSGTADAVKHRRQVMDDPNSSFNDKVEVNVEVAASALATLIAAFGTAHELAPDIKKVFKEMKNKTPHDAANELASAANDIQDPVADQAVLAAANALREFPSIKVSSKGKEVERIAAAAIRTPDGEIHKGASHAEIKAEILKENTDVSPEVSDYLKADAEKPLTAPVGFDEGFVNQNDEFKNRTESKRVAAEANQLDPGAEAEGDELHSHQIKDDELLGATKTTLTEAKSNLREMLIALQETLEMAGFGPAGKKTSAVLEAEQRWRDRFQAMKTELTEKLRTSKTESSARIKELRDKMKFFDSEGRLDASAIRRSLLDVAAQLPRSERGQFMGKITESLMRPSLGRLPEMMYRNAMEVSWRMMSKIDELEKKGVVDELQGLIERIMGSKAVDVDYKNRLAGLTGKIRFHGLTPETESMLLSRKDFIGRSGDAHGIPEYAINQLELLSQTAAKDLPLTVLQDMVDKVKMIEELGRLKVKARAEVEAFQMERMRADLKKSKSKKLENLGMIRTPGETLGWTDEMSKQLQNKFRSADNLSKRSGRTLLKNDVIADFLDGNARYYGPVIRNFIGKMDSAYNARNRMVAALKKPLVELIKQSNLDNVSFERISIYAISREENGIQRLKDSGVGEKQIKETILTKEEKTFYDRARQILDDDAYPAIKKYMKDNHNIEVAKIDNYWPFQRDYELYDGVPETQQKMRDMGEEVPYDELALWKDGLGRDLVSRNRAKTAQGFTIERLPNARGAVKLNALEVLGNHFDQVSHFLTHDKDLAQLNKIAREPWFVEKYGTGGRKWALDRLDTIARDAGPNASERSPILDFLTSNLAVASLGFRVINQVLHLANYPLALTQVNVKFLRRGFTHALTKTGRSFIKENFAEIYQRSGGEQALKDLETGNWWNKAQSESFFVEKSLDQHLSGSVAIGRYIQELHRAGKDWRNWDTIPLDVEARNRALISSRIVAASPLLKDVPMAISRGKLTAGHASLTRAVFQFQNTMLNQTSFLKHDIWDSTIRDFNPTALAVNSLAMLGVLMIESSIKNANKSLIGYVSGSPTPKDEKDSYAKELAMELTRRFPGVGQIISMYSYGQTGVPVADEVLGAVKTIKKIAEDKSQHPAVDAAILAATVSGVPGTGFAAQIARKALARKPGTSYLDK